MENTPKKSGNLENQGHNQNLGKTFVYSGLAHIILLLIFYFTTVSTSLSLPEFVEINFVQTGQPAKRPVKPRTEPVIEKKENPTPQEKTVDEVEIPKEIQLPKRRMLEDKTPDLQAAANKKRTPSTVPSSTPQKEGTSKETFKPGTVTDEKEDFQPDNLADLNLPNSENTRSNPGIESSLFEIEGKAAERKIMTKILPEYPPGYNKEALIKFRFKVLANGHVAQIIPIMKYDAVLEANALSAFTRWQFNPLPRNVPQEAVEGTITFRYKLR